MLHPISSLKFHLRQSTVEKSIVSHPIGCFEGILLSMCETQFIRRHLSSSSVPAQRISRLFYSSIVGTNYRRWRLRRRCRIGELIRFSRCVSVRLSLILFACFDFRPFHFNGSYFWALYGEGFAYARMKGKPVAIDGAVRWKTICSENLCGIRHLLLGSVIGLWDQYLVYRLA